MKKQISRLWLLALFLIASGVAGLVYFFLFFDTSLPLPDGVDFGFERVNNLGLMNDRQNGIIVSAVVLVIGVALAIAKYVKKDGAESHKIYPTQERPLPPDRQELMCLIHKLKKQPPKK